jgi:hypothetical protein
LATIHTAASWLPENWILEKNSPGTLTPLLRSRLSGKKYPAEVRGLTKTKDLPFQVEMSRVMGRPALLKI